MADIAELTNILSNAGVGTAPDSKVAGAAPGTGLNVFAFRDSSGNLVLPQLDASGAIVVAAPVGVRKSATAKTLAVVNTDTDAVTMALVADKVYRGIQVVVSNTRDTAWHLVWNDDGTPTTVAFLGVTGAGAYTLNIKTDDLEFTAGSTGTQELKVVGNQFQANASDMRATLIAVENDA